MLLQGNSLSLLHQQGAKTLMLELGWVPGGHWNNTAIHVELSDHRAASLELRPVALFRELSEPEEPNEDVLLWVLVAEESFPTPVGRVVSPHQFNLVRSDLVVDLLNSNLMSEWIINSFDDDDCVFDEK